MKRRMTVAAMALVALGLAVPAAASATGTQTKQAPKAQASTNTRFSKMKAQLSTTRAQVSKRRKRCPPGWKRPTRNHSCIKKWFPTLPTGPLTEPEVKAQINLKSGQYCDVDLFCTRHGSIVDYPGGPLSCDTKSTYEWACIGYNEEGYSTQCRFREIVDRTSYGGVTSHQDTTYGYAGWDCY